MTTVIHEDEGVQSRWVSPDRGGVQRAVSAGKAWTRISLCWRATLNFFAPIGYEDAAGFHYGNDSEATSGE